MNAQVPLAWGAHRAANIIAEQLSGNKNITFKGFLGSNIVKFFDYTFASVGIKPEELSLFNYEMVEIKSGAHAEYYPGNTPYTYVSILIKTIDDYYAPQQLENKAPINALIFYQWL